MCDQNFPTDADYEQALQVNAELREDIARLKLVVQDLIDEVNEMRAGYRR